MLRRRHQRPRLVLLVATSSHRLWTFSLVVRPSAVTRTKRMTGNDCLIVTFSTVTQNLVQNVQNEDIIKAQWIFLALNVRSNSHISFHLKSCKPVSRSLSNSRSVRSCEAIDQLLQRNGAAFETTTTGTSSTYG